MSDSFLSAPAQTVNEDHQRPTRPADSKLATDIHNNFKIKVFYTPEERRAAELSRKRPADLAADIDTLMEYQDCVIALLKEVRALRIENQDNEECLVEAQAYARESIEKHKRTKSLQEHYYRAAEKGRRAQSNNQILRKKMVAPLAGCGEPPECLAILRQRLHRFGDTIHCPPCVYFLMDGTTLIYVGQTVDLLARIGAHYDGGRGKVFDSAFYIPVNPDNLSEVEAVFIEFFKPTQNESRPGCEMFRNIVMLSYGLK